MGRLIGTTKKSFISSTSRKGLLKRAFKTFLRDSNDDHESSWSDLFRIRQILKKSHGQFNASISFYDHHITHQEYGEKMKNLNDYISLSYDGGGETDSTVLSVVKSKRKTIISKHKWPNSLGHFYSTFTGFLGFKMLEGEYKMMGLAPYGRPIFKDLILKEVLNIDRDGYYKLNLDLCDYHAALEGKFNQKFISLFGLPRSPKDCLLYTSPSPRDQ